MNQSDTPRTDAQATGNSDPQQDEYEDLLYFTRTLERELTAARAELAEWHDAAESVKAEYPDEVHCTCVPILRKQIKTLTEQRDDLLRYNEAFRNETLFCADCDSISKGEYDQAIEQRDRLAKAVNAATILIAAKGRHNTMLAYEGLRDALQSLTTNEQ